MGVGRFFCVALPFILTVASILCMLIAGLTGVTNTKALYIFRIDVSNVTIDASTIATIAGLDDTVTNQIEQLTGRAPATADDIASGLDSVAALNGLTAADLGLGKVYDISLWGYCVTWQDDSHNCTKPQYNWAEASSSSENNTLISQMQSMDGVNDTALPAVMDGLEAFEKLNKWTEVVYIIAMIGLGLELAVGLFTACSSAVSCVTWFISGIATLFVVASAVLVTVMATVAVGTIEGAASEQGAHASYNTSYLAVIWLGAAFAIAASSFWLLTICCCKPERRPYSRKGNHGETEKFIPTGSYQPIGETHQPGYNYGAPQRGGARSDLAYEPYSHARA
ncbi:hypothetical protein SLS62_011404 [Diatrype stigma]|uniref:SUR7 protein n=1 Tax=Diatrype stigma TaxID=117547 RepID=A0AAN9U5L2_9PEZI